MIEPSPQRLVVGAVIVDELTCPSRVLAARRLRGPASVAGRWEFPGGKVEPGESPEQALVRELGEELLFVARLGSEIVNPHAPTWRISDRYDMRLWFVEAVGPPPRLGSAHSEIRWLCGDQLRLLDWLDADVAVLNHLTSRAGGFLSTGDCG